MKTYLDPKEAQSLEDQANNLRDRLLIRILFRLGCRVSEALALCTGDVDLERGMVKIQHMKVRLRLSCPECATALRKSHRFCPKCGANVNDAVAKELKHRRQRILPIDGDTIALLKDYIVRGGPIGRGDKTLVFGINRHRAWQVVKECAEKAGLPKLINPETGKVHNVSPHRLRDAFAVNAVKHDDSGDGLRLLQEHLGHQSFNTTAKYRKISGEEQRDWYEKLWEEGK